MLLGIKAFAGYNVDASDGPVGTVLDAGLDDEEWLIRGVVIDTPGSGGAMCSCPCAPYATSTPRTRS
jgi:hypothetical protein